MNTEDFDKELDSLELPDIKIEGHQRRLKSALLSSYQAKQPRKVLSPIWKVAPVGLMAALLLMAGINLTSPGKLFKTEAVQAKEVVASAIKTVTKTPEDVLVRETSSIPNVPDSATSFSTKDMTLGSLEEAERAKDLEYLGVKVLKNGDRIKVLRFTDDKGLTTILGIKEKSNIPVVRFGYNDNGGYGISNIDGPEGQLTRPLPEQNGNGTGTQTGMSGGSGSVRTDAPLPGAPTVGSGGPPLNESELPHVKMIEQWTKNLEPATR